MKAQVTLAVAGSCVLLLLAGCDRTGVDRLGESTRGSVTAVTEAGTEVARTAAESAAETGRDVAEASRAVAGAADRPEGRAAGPHADSSITSRARAALEAEQAVAASDIEVATSQGKVTLSGRVPDAWQAERAVQLVSRVEGVREVESRLTTP
jgi:hyperosmotically inducible periplasmic protein